MLQAEYQNKIYTFYVTTEDVRIDTSVPSANLWYLFKFTNDMSGSVQFAYGQNTVIYDRYTKVEFYHTELYRKEGAYQGLINLSENGYYKYEIYECSSLTIINNLNECNAPTSLTGTFGDYKISNFAGTLLASNNFTATKSVFYNQFVDNLDGSNDSPITVNPIVQNDPCGNNLGSQGLYVPLQQRNEDSDSLTTLENCVQTSTGITFDVVSNMPIGYSYAFRQNVLGSPEFQVTDITTKPQTTSHSLAQFTPYNQNLVELRCYTLTGGAVGGGGTGFNKIYNIYPHKTPTDRFGLVTSLITNHELVDGATVISKGNAFYMASNGTSLNSNTSGLLKVNGEIEVGKLLVSEKKGFEQVQYKQYESPKTKNYIYND